MYIYTRIYTYIHSHTYAILIQAGGVQIVIGDIPWMAQSLEAFKLPWREAGPPNHHDDKVYSDQKVVNKDLSLLQIVIGDIPWVAQRLEAYVSTLLKGNTSQSCSRVPAYMYLSS